MKNLNIDKLINLSVDDVILKLDSIFKRIFFKIFLDAISYTQYIVLLIKRRL